MTTNYFGLDTVRPVIFLDIDGVISLNAIGWDVFKAFQSNEFYPALWESAFDTAAVENLKRLHDEFNPHYVISSSWRRELTLEQFRILFEQTGMYFVSSSLHAVWCTSAEDIPNRSKEIFDWITLQRCEAPFLIIDDSSSGNDLSDTALHAAGHVVLCSPAFGFTNDCLVSSRALLRAQYEEADSRFKMRPIMFLDLDDVLVARTNFNSYQVIELFALSKVDEWPELWDGLHAEAKINLKSLDAEFSPLYVISSSWTTKLTQKQMVTVFERTDLDFVASNLHTVWTTPKRNGSSRNEEIEAWLVNHHNAEAILVLDDYHSGNSLIHSKLRRDGKVVLCDVNECFVGERLSEAQCILRAQYNGRSNQL